MGCESNRILAAFAGVTFTAHSIHGDRKRFVRLGTDAAEAHCTGAESFDDFTCRLHFV